MRSYKPLSDKAVTIPKWYQSAIDDLEVASSRINTAHDSLAMASNREVKDFYSNATLHKQVDKSQECKEVLNQLIIVGDKIAKMIEQNHALYKKQWAEFLQKKSDAELKHNQLIDALTSWQKKANTDSAEVSAQFKAIKESLSKNKTSDGMSIVNAYKPFLAKYGYLVELVINTKGLVESYKLIKPPQVPPVSELRKKSHDELKKLVDLTQDRDLILQATRLKLAEEDASSCAEYLDSIEPTWLQKVDAEEIRKIDDQAKKLAKEYYLAAEKIEQIGKVAFETIKEQEETILKSINENIKVITCAINFFKTAFDKVNNKSNASSQDMRTAVTKFDELETVNIACKQFKVDVQKTIGMLAEFYKKAGNNLGVYRVEALRKFESDTNALQTKLDGLITQVDSLNIKMGNAIDSYKVRIAKENLLALLEFAIEKNLNFWHDQVSQVWGSRAKVNNISVPIGIAKMVEDLRIARLENKSVDETLLELRNTAALRTQAHPGYFARRAEKTTDAFYNLLNYDLRYFSDFNLQQIQASLDAIEDTKGRKLAKPSVIELKKRVRNYRHVNGDNQRALREHTL